MMMRGAVLAGTRDLHVAELDVPSVGANQVKIAVTLNGLCGTDVTEYAKAQRMVPTGYTHPGSGHHGPTALGHEFIGEVIEAGPGAEHLLGSRVACGAGVSCGHCARCLEGRTNLCDTYYTLGLSTHGGLAEFVVAPASICVPIPAGLPDSEAVLAQPLAVGIHAAHRAGVRAGDRVAILGVGAIGTFIAAGLQGSGAELTAFDLEPARLELARELGVQHGEVITGPESLAAFAPFDVVFECVGVNGMAQAAYSLTRSGGTTVLVGLSAEPQSIDVTDVVLREISTVTTVAHVCAVDLPEALKLLERFPLAHLLVDQTIGLSELVEGGMDRLADGGFSGKVIVDVRG
ncbi:MAG: zinc-binding dehydrogenase [Agromyces sp.]